MLEIAVCNVAGLILKMPLLKRAYDEIFRL